MRAGSGTFRCLRAIRAGRVTVPDIATAAHVTNAEARTYLKRLAKMGLVERIPAHYVLVERK